MPRVRKQPPVEQKRKTYARYGGYWTVREGKLYGTVNVPLGGGKYKKKLKRVANKTEAKQWALDQLGKSRDGENVFEDTRRVKFSDFAEWYKTEYLIPPVYKNGKRVVGLRTYKQQRSTADRLIKAFGSLDLKKITADVLRRHKQTRLKTVSVTSVNRDFALMRTMLIKAARRKLIAENPFDFSEESLIETDLEATRQSLLTHRIVVRLLARSRKNEQPLLHYLILVLKNTGARPSEAYPYSGHDPDVVREPLIWKNILDFDFRVVRLVSYKGKKRKERLVPTSVELERGLRKFYAESKPKPEDLLFPVTTFKRAWATLCRSVRVEGVRIRDFRHYYNSRLVQNPNINDMERLLLMGHVNMQTNARYSHLDDNFVKKYRDVIDLGTTVN